MLIVQVLENGLTSIPDLSSLGGALQVLSVSSQGGITSIQNLEALVNLKELYLHDNSITKIDSLSRCTNLQILWLCSNRISTIENLDALVELRELWLQDNQITVIPKFNNLNMEVLHLSANKIEDLKAIKPLLELPSLMELSFKDNHWLGCPFTTADTYRNYVIFYLTQLQVLDGFSINDRDRDQENDPYQQNIRAFNVKLDQLKKQSKEQLQAIQAKRQSVDEKLAIMKRQLMDSFLNFEKALTEGRQKVINDHIEQTQHRQDRKKKLDKNLGNLKAKYTAEIAKLIQKEKSKLKAEDKYFNQLQLQLQHEEEHDSFFLNLHKTSQGVLSYVIDQQAPEYRFVKSYFMEQSTNLYKLIKVYKLYNEAIIKQLERVQTPQPEDVKEVKRLFYFASVSKLYSIIQKGFQSEDGTSVTLCYETFSDTILPEPDSAIQAVLLCKVTLLNTAVISDPIKELDTGAILRKLPTGCQSCCLENVSGNRVYLLFTKKSILPEYCVLFASPGSYLQRDKLGEHLKSFLVATNVSNLVTPSLAQLEKQVDEEIQAYQKQLL